MLKEAQWSKTKYVPTIDEYMANAYVSFALGPIVLPTLYLVGPKLPTDLAENPEFNRLYELMSTSGRLLNDFNGYKVYILPFLSPLHLLPKYLLDFIWKNELSF